MSNVSRPARFRRILPRFLRNHSSEEKKSDGKIKAKITRAICAENLPVIDDILAKSNHLRFHAIEKAVARGKVNIAEMLIENLTVDSRFARKLFRIAMINNKVECFDLIGRLCVRFDLIRLFNPKEIHNLEVVFRYGFEHFQTETLNWAIHQCKTISSNNDNCNIIFGIFPEKIENWGVLQWLKDRGFPINPNQKQINNLCKNAFESRQIGVLFWLRKHGITLLPNAEMLLCMTHMTFEPLREIVGPDVYGVIFKYFR